MIMEDQMIIRNMLLGKMKPGDHIASSRRLVGQYQHHGIYMGKIDGVHKVTHFKAPIKDSSISAKNPVVKCNVCDYMPPQDGGRVTSCLDCFCRGENICIIRYKVTLPNWQSTEDIVAKRIICGYLNDNLYLELYKGADLFGHTKISSDDVIKTNIKVDNQILLSKYHSCRSPEQVLEAAQSNHYMGKYSFLFNNCEDFAVHCMTGKERSIQARNKLHKVTYRTGKTLHMLTDRRKLKDKLKEKALRCLADSSSCYEEKIEY